MIDQIKRLEKVDEMLKGAEVYAKCDMPNFTREMIADARQELQETIEQIREAQQAAIELLTRLRDDQLDADYPAGTYSLTNDDWKAITKAIGLLGGSGEEGEDASDGTHIQ